MGLAYGAAKNQTDGYAARIGVVIDGNGNVQEYEPRVDAKAYPTQVLSRI